MGSEQGATEEHGFEGRKKISSAKTAELQGLMSNLWWGWKKAANEAINDGHIGENMKKLLAQALASQRKLAAEATKMLNKDSGFR